MPGWLIPSLYSDYARSAASGSPSPPAIDDMTRVFYHNREDIVSMVPLAAMPCSPFENSGNDWLKQPLHPVDCASLGRGLQEVGWPPPGAPPSLGHGVRGGRGLPVPAPSRPPAPAAGRRPPGGGR